MSERTRWSSKAKLAPIVAAAAALAFSAPASAADWQYHEIDGDYYWDAASIDRNGNGWPEEYYFDLDNDGPWDTNLYNTRYHDSFHEVVDYDMDENAEVEIRLRDGDQRQGFDYILVDRDQDGRWDRWRGFARRIVPGSNIDVVNTANRRNASSRLIYDFGRRTGMSLLYPTPPTPY